MVYALLAQGRWEEYGFVVGIENVGLGWKRQGEVEVREPEVPQAGFLRCLGWRGTKAERAHFARLKRGSCKGNLEARDQACAFFLLQQRHLMTFD